MSAMLPYVPPTTRLTPSRVWRQSQALLAEGLSVDLDMLPVPACVLNPARQIVLANDALSNLVGGRTVLGLRLGEAAECRRVKDAAAGCGTSPECAQCGSARLISHVEQSGEARVEECRIATGHGENTAALDLQVSARAIERGGGRFVFAVAVDISDRKRREALEQTFYHDVLNTLGALSGYLALATELRGEESVDFARDARRVAAHAIEEVQLQRDLCAAERGDLQVQRQAVHVGRVLEELARDWSTHRLAEGRRVVVRAGSGDGIIETDPVLVRRVLTNLVKNALEASRHGHEVTLWFDRHSTTFGVHNPGVMPPEVQAQIFQRSFSTKGTGRGIGTHSVRLLTERYLAGTVAFSSAAGRGTTFTVCLGDTTVRYGEPSQREEAVAAVA